jgi:PAS domain S-box-containing protein
MLPTKTSTILIVDDQPTNLKLLFSLLQKSGLKVLVAKTGESAIEKLQNVSPDLILLDVRMPGIDGFETCRHIKASPKTQDIPVIFMTGISEAKDRIEGLKLGAVDYITKPFQQEEVLARIENHLKLRRRQKQIEEENKRLQQEISDRRKIEKCSRAMLVNDEAAQAVHLSEAHTDITECKQVEDRNHALLAAIPDVIFRQRVDGTYLDVRANEGSSIVPADLIGKNLHTIPSLLPEAVKEGILAHVQAAVETGKLQIYEYEIPMPDGVRTYESRCVKSGADEAIRIVRDVTERKIAEAALLQSEARFRGIFESAAIGIGLTGANGRLIEANPTLEAFLGYSSSEIRRQDFANITHPDDRTADSTLTKEVIEGVRDSFQLEKRYIRKDGQFFWGRVTVSAVRNQAGEFQFTVAIVEDITDRKKAEERLRLLESAVVHANDAVIVAEAEPIDFPGPKIIYVNEAFTRMTGYSAKEAIGKTPRILQGAKTDRTQLDRIRQALQGWQSVRVELTNYRKDGSQFWAELEIVPVADKKGWFTHWVSVQRDITARKQAEIELAAAKTALERQIQRALLLGQITQEIRSSLNPEQIFQTAANQIGQAFSVNRCLIHTYVDQPTPHIPLVAEYFEPGRESIQSLEMPMIGNPHAMLLLTQESAIASDNVYTDPLLEAASSTHQQLGLKSMLAVRTSYHGKPNGVICLHQYDRFHHWRDEEIELLESVAAQMGIALAQSDLLEHEKEQRIELDQQNQLLQQEIRVRQQAQEALKKSEERWQLALQGNNDGIWDWNIKTGEVFRSSRFKEMLGYEDHEMGHLFDESGNLIHPDDFERVMDAWKAYLDRTSPQYVIEFRLRCKNGSYKWILARGQAQWDEAGSPVRMVGSYQDISEQKLAEAALASSEKQYRDLVETSQDMIFSVDAQGRFTFVNSAVKQIYGYDPTEMIGRSLTDFMPPEQIAEDLEVFQQLLKRESVFQYETTHLAKDGRPIQLMLNAIALRDDEGNVLGTTGTASDITRRKIAEEELKKSEARFREKTQQLELALDELKRTQSQLIQAEKMSSLGQMVAGIAHEINNPVSFIYGNITPASEYVQDLLHLVELYRHHYPKPVKEIAEQLERIEPDFLAEDFPKLLASMTQGANRISQIVLSLRNFARLDEKESKQVDIHEGIDNTLAILQHKLRAVGDSDRIEVIKNYGQLPLVTCYPSQLNQVFMNLLNNAIDALKTQPAPRRITICTSVETEDSRSSYEERGGECLNSYPNLSTNLHPQTGQRQGAALTSRYAITNAPLTPSCCPQFVVIRIADNGPGMSEDVQKKIFDPFFTTKDVGSGTGLGLSISYQIVVEKHKGRLSCISVLGQGTQLIVEIPVNSEQ